MPRTSPSRAVPGHELWDSREALAAHFRTPHMRPWAEQRAALGFFDRRIALHEIGAAEDLRRCL
jgi:quinol monooxygenase YgiN